MYGKPIPGWGNVCPLHKKDMSKVCPTCPLWVKVLGKNPQSEETIERWDCSLALLPLMLIENSQAQRQTGAAVETFRNEVVKSNAQNVAAFAHALHATAEAMSALHRETVGNIAAVVTAVGAAVAIAPPAIKGGQ